MTMPSEETSGGQVEIDSMRRCMDIATAQMAGLEAENVRLRGLLKEAAEWFRGGDFVYPTDLYERMVSGGNGDKRRV